MRMLTLVEHGAVFKLVEYFSRLCVRAVLGGKTHMTADSGLGFPNALKSVPWSLNMALWFGIGSRLCIQIGRRRAVAFQRLSC